MQHPPSQLQFFYNIWLFSSSPYFFIAFERFLTEVQYSAPKRAFLVRYTAPNFTKGIYGVLLLDMKTNKKRLKSKAQRHIIESKVRKAYLFALKKADGNNFTDLIKFAKS